MSDQAKAAGAHADSFRWAETAMTISKMSESQHTLESDSCHRNGTEKEKVRQGKRIKSDERERLQA